MKFPASVLAIAAGLAAVANSSWVVPRDLEDGLYTVTFSNTDDTASAPIVKRQLVVPAFNVTAVPPKKENKPYKRPQGIETEPEPIDRFSPKYPPLRVNNTCNENLQSHLPFDLTEGKCSSKAPPLDEQSWYQARDSLYDYCDRYSLAPKRKVIAVSKSGNVIAYACNYGRLTTRTCSRQEYRHASDYYFDGGCGLLRPAWIQMYKTMKEYGRAHTGMPICTRRRQMEEQDWSGASGRLFPENNAAG